MATVREGKGRVIASEHAELEQGPLRELLELMPAAIAVLRGPDHRWSYVNAAYLKVVGRARPEELLGKPIRPTLPEMAGQGFFELLDRVYETGQPFNGTEMRVLLNRGPDGRSEAAYFNLLYHPLKDRTGKVEGIFVHAVEVTGQVAEESARRKLAAIVESSDDAIVSKDLNGIITSWNEAAQRIFGYTAAEIIGKPITTIIPPELHDDETRILAKLRRGERIDHFETVRVTKTGERIDVSLTISPVRDERGRIVGAAKIARDITQRKKAEEALRMSEKLATSGRLAATVAHEINNPLESVVNLVYLARHQNGLPQNVREYLRAAEEELDRISQLTKQALGFYREKTSAISTRIAPIISQLRTILSPKLSNKRIDLRIDADQDPEIVAVPGELRQLFANLLTNSIDAVPVGGAIRVRISRAHANHAGTPGVRVTIADSGPGIDPAHRPKIFEPFFTTKKEVGTGLGLWVSKGIVERHGGTIRLRSTTTRGKSGTVFTVFLPVNAPEANAPPVASAWEEAV